jgi:DNA polymerase IV
LTALLARGYTRFQVNRRNPEARRVRLPPRSVLFVDPPAFCTTVEELVAPALRTRPIAVAPPGAERAVVLALSDEARLAGVTRGMAVRLAQKRCPDLILLPPNPRLYARASRALHEILRRYAPVIEPRGYGHAFLDLTGTRRLFGPAVDVAARVQREVRERIRLPVAVGVAVNKLVSQAAIRVGSEGVGRRSGAEPWEVRAGDERGFLAPVSIELWPEVPDRIRRRLDDYQLDLIGEVAAITESALCAVFGGAGRMLRAQARGIDPRPVLSPEQQAEFRVAHALTTDTNDLGVLYPLLRLLGERLGRRLRRRGLVARRLRVALGYADHTDAARAVTLKAAALDIELWEAARRAFALANAKRLAVRCVSLTLDQIEEAETQIDLWDEGELADQEALAAAAQPAPPHRPSIPPLQSAVDRIRTRYGTGAIGRAVTALPGRAHRTRAARGLVPG